MMTSQNSHASNHADARRPSGRHDVVRDYLAVARGSDLVVIRVVGSGNLLLAPALCDFADEQLKAGFRRFVFDLERCRGLDSTFMGVMVGLHNALRTESGLYSAVKADAPQPGEQIEELTPEQAAAELRAAFNRTRADKPENASAAEDAGAAINGLISAVNLTSDVRNVMGMLGVDKFVKVRGACDLKQLETTMLPEKNLPPDERRRLILKAHENLVEIDKRNEAQFGPFLKTLSKELAGS
jgi:hypothetical protein